MSEDPSPFDWEPSPDRANGAAALCLHGLTGTPYEMRPVAQVLRERGFRTRAPWMAGHAEGHLALEQTEYADWVELARNELAALRSEYERVVLCGVSMGGLVSLRLAQTEVVEGVVTVGVPLRLSAATRFLLPLVRPFLPHRTKRGSDIQDPAARARHPGLEAMPLASVRELIRLQAVVSAELGKVTAPILISHGRLDRTAHPRDAEVIHAGVASESKELFYLERSGHVSTVDYDGEALARAAGDFLDRCVCG
ncbi:MAG: alpha/beta hydrolase [Myxococcota bacterium]